MKASETRILTTHVGSLPRGEALAQLLIARDHGEKVDPHAFDRALDVALDTIVDKQIASGVDVVSDGELPRIGFSIYAKDRMSGFGGESKRNRSIDLKNFPKYAEMLARRTFDPKKQKLPKVWNAPQALGAVHYDDTLAHVRAELDHFEAALKRTKSARPAETFVTAASPGIVSTTMLRAADNPAYRSERDYVMALGREMKKEYDHIVARGHVLQLDAPDLAMDKQAYFQDRPIAEFFARVELHIEALNLALADIPPEKVRLHVCFGNWDGPHTEDVELEPLLPLLYQAKVGALSLACGNPRHQHDWKALRKNPPPAPMVLIPGVIDVTTNYVEHPEVVADRICQFAEAMDDPRRVIASTDCGFGTFAAYSFVAEDVVWAKLATLAEGARRATKRLFA
ncbi:MAG: methionine synthase [Alphaproteobacteria bacterium]|nr:methionine synthase [Alphaproteobacteria bacterium]